MGFSNHMYVVDTLVTTSGDSLMVRGGKAVVMINGVDGEKRYFRQGDNTDGKA